MQAPVYSFQGVASLRGVEIPFANEKAFRLHCDKIISELKVFSKISLGGPSLKDRFQRICDYSSQLRQIGMGREIGEKTIVEEGYEEVFSTICVGIDPEKLFLDLYSSKQLVEFSQRAFSWMILNRRKEAISFAKKMLQNFCTTDSRSAQDCIRLLNGFFDVYRDEGGDVRFKDELKHIYPVFTQLKISGEQKSVIVDFLKKNWPSFACSVIRHLDKKASLLTDVDQLNDTIGLHDIIVSLRTGLFSQCSSLEKMLENLRTAQDPSAEFSHIQDLVQTMQTMERQEREAFAKVGLSSGAVIKDMQRKIFETICSQEFLSHKETSFLQLITHWICSMDLLSIDDGKTFLKAIGELALKKELFLDQVFAAFDPVCLQFFDDESVQAYQAIKQLAEKVTSNGTLRNLLFFLKDANPRTTVYDLFVNATDVPSRKIAQYLDGIAKTALMMSCKKLHESVEGTIRVSRRSREEYLRKQEATEFPLFSEIPSYFRSDKKIVLCSLSRDWREYSGVKSPLKQDPDIMRFVLLSSSGDSDETGVLEQIPDDFQKSEDMLRRTSLVEMAFLNLPQDDFWRIYVPAIFSGIAEPEFLIKQYIHLLRPENVELPEIFLEDKDFCRSLVEVVHQVHKRFLTFVYTPTMMRSRTFVRELFSTKRSVPEIQTLSPEIQDDEELILLGLKNSLPFEHASERLKRDLSTIRVALESNLLNYAYVAEDCRSIPELALSVVSKKGTLLFDVPEALASNHAEYLKIVQAAVENDPAAVLFISRSFLENAAYAEEIFKIQKKAVLRDINVLPFAVEALQRDKELIINSLHQEQLKGSGKQNCAFFLTLPKEIREDVEIVQVLLSIYQQKIFPMLPEIVWNNKDIIQTAISISSEALKFIPEAFETDEVIHAAFSERKGGSGFCFLSEKNKERYEIATKAVLANPQNMLHIPASKYSEEQYFHLAQLAVVQESSIIFSLFVERSIKSHPFLRKEHSLALIEAAARRNSFVFSEFMHNFTSDEEVIRVALEASEGGKIQLSLLKHLSRHPRYLDIVKKVLKNDGVEISNIPQELRSKELSLIAVAQNGNAIAFFSEELQNDPEVQKIARHSFFKDENLDATLISETLKRKIFFGKILQ